jgi:tRNA acetyltransferase TAN1
MIVSSALIRQNVCGMSVVGNDFEELKRFNLAEIYQPTPQPINDAMPPPQEITDAAPAT